MASPKLKVFLCHSSTDKPIVRDLYQRLFSEPWLDPWLDEENLLPGQDWDMEIEKAVEAADAVLVCVSNNSVTKEGYVQRELKFALDVALEKPEGSIFIVPLRLDDCNLPRRLRTWQYVDYFPTQQREKAYQRLLQSLKIRLSDSQPRKNQSENIPSFEAEPLVSSVVEEKIMPAKSLPSDHVTVSLPTTFSGILAIVWSILPIVFFAMMTLNFLGDTTSKFYFLTGIVAVLTSAIIAYMRQIVASRVVKFSTIFFAISHTLWMYADYKGLQSSTAFAFLNGIAVLIAGGALIFNFQTPRKSATYSSVFFATFIFLYGYKIIANYFNAFPNEIQIPMVVIGIIAAIFLWFGQ